MAGPEALDAGATRAWVDAFVAELTARREALGDLDRRSGDGDYGNNLKTALDKIEAALATADVASPGTPFTAISTAFLGTGGTSGPLYGMWFRSIAALADERGALDLAALAEGTAAGLASVQRLGKAEVGDKTMVDAMAPAVAALAAADEAGEGLDAGLAAAARAAREGADGTEAMIARRGRASYVGEVARGVVDPGAATVALFFEAAPRASS
jgi:phosphoenolpyruvate---glycerone phosphotransferase subunit DhaL